MITSDAHENRLLQVENAAHERELDHRAGVISDLADRLAATQAELADAVALGTQYAALLRAVSPDALSFALRATGTALSRPFSTREGAPTSDDAEAVRTPHFVRLIGGPHDGRSEQVDVAGAPVVLSCGPNVEGVYEPMDPQPIVYEWRGHRVSPAWEGSD